MTTLEQLELEFPVPVNVNFDAVDNALALLYSFLPSRKKLLKIICQNDPNNEPRLVSPYRHQHKELAKVIRELKIHKTQTIQIVNDLGEHVRFLDKICSLHAQMLEKYVIKGNKKKRSWVKELAESKTLEYHPIDL